MEGIADSLQQIVQKGAFEETHCIRCATNDRGSFLLTHEFSVSCEEFTTLLRCVKTLYFPDY